jgi:hypothetical protein
MLRRSFQIGLIRCCLLLFFGLAALELRAEDLNIEAQLIWGTNAEKSPDPSHKPVDKPTAEKLRKVFKWKNYFLVNQQNTIIKSRTTKLIGDQKPVNKTVKPLSKGECFVITGEDENESPWFIIIKQN